MSDLTEKKFLLMIFGFVSFLILPFVANVTAQEYDSSGGLVGYPLRFEITYPREVKVGEDVQVKVRIWTILEEGLDVERVVLTLQYRDDPAVYEETMLYNVHLDQSGIVKTITIKLPRVADWGEVQAHVDAVYLEQGVQVHRETAVELGGMKVVSPSFLPFGLWESIIIAIIIVSVVCIIYVALRKTSRSKDTISNVKQMTNTMFNSFIPSQF